MSLMNVPWNNHYEEPPWETEPQLCGCSALLHPPPHPNEEFLTQPCPGEHAGWSQASPETCRWLPRKRQRRRERAACQDLVSFIRDKDNRQLFCWLE